VSDPCLSALRLVCDVLQKERYINPLIYLPTREPYVYTADKNPPAQRRVLFSVP